MPELDAIIEFEVFCTCGNGLCSVTSVRYSKIRNIPQLEIDPCPICKKASYEEGYDKGYIDGNEKDR